MVNVSQQKTQGATRHTPGPWSADGVAIVAGDGGLVTVALVTPETGNGLGNSRLIAAAPEMYRNAKATVERLADLPRWLRDNGADSLARIVAQELANHRAAIAKAEG